MRLSSRKLRTSLHELRKAINVITTGRWMFYCAVVGIVTGLAAITFGFLLELIKELTLVQSAGFEAIGHDVGNIDIWANSLAGLLENENNLRKIDRWLLLIFPSIGGLLSGFLVYCFAPEAEGHGTDSVIRAFHKKKGVIKPVVPFVKLVASAFTIGTGGSAGKEGPIGQIGAGIGSYFAGVFKLSETERRILLLAGMGAGIGAIFKAPIGGALFAIEVMYKKDMESEGLVAAILASIVAYSVYASVDGWNTIFKFQAATFTNPVELLLFILLAFIVMFFGIFYTQIFKKTGLFFREISIPRYLKPVIGGLLVGIIAFFMPAVMGSSYGYLQNALDGHLSLSFMGILVISKMFTTAFTIQSGGSGGVFAPSLVIGGLLGGVFGNIADSLFPGLLINPNAYVLVGMAAFFAGVANVPVSSTILITEMSQSYGLIVPLIFASVISYLGAQNWSLYSEQIEDRNASIANRNSFLHSVLKSIKVRSVYHPLKKIPILHHKNSVREILNVFARSEALILPVENDQKEIVGMISLHDARNVLIPEGGYQAIIAVDLMVPVRCLNMNDSLDIALDYFIETGEPELLVLQHASSRNFIGVLSERDFLLAYQKAMSES